MNSLKKAACIYPLSPALYLLQNALSVPALHHDGTDKRVMKGHRIGFKKRA